MVWLPGIELLRTEYYGVIARFANEVKHTQRLLDGRRRDPNKIRKYC